MPACDLLKNLSTMFKSTLFACVAMAAFVSVRAQNPPMVNTNPKENPANYRPHLIEGDTVYTLPRKVKFEGEWSDFVIQQWAHPEQASCMCEEVTLLITAVQYSDGRIKLQSIQTPESQIDINIWRASAERLLQASKGKWEQPSINDHKVNILIQQGIAAYLSPDQKARCARVDELLHAGTLALEQGNLQTATEMSQKAQKVSPNDARLQLFLSVLDTKKGNSKKACRRMEKLKKQGYLFADEFLANFCKK